MLMISIVSHDSPTVSPLLRDDGLRVDELTLPPGLDLLRRILEQAVLPMCH
jgi:hypothetical protein